MPVSFETIIQEAQDLCGEVAGSGTQTYGEDRMLRDATRAFNLLYKKYPWEQYCTWSRLALDGTLGIVTTNDLQNVRDYEDFVAVHKDGDNNPLSVLPMSLNPYAIGSGSTVVYWTSLVHSDSNFALKKLQFYPVTAVGYVNVRAKIYPLDAGESFVPSDEVHLDKDLLTYATAFMTLAIEDLNPNAANVCKGLMDVRYKDILSALAARQVSLGQGPTYLTDWQQIP